jgi:hypothetical protein
MRGWKSVAWLRKAGRRRSVIGAAAMGLAGGLAAVLLVLGVSSGQAAAATPPEGGLRGSQPLVTLLCKFADVDAEPLSVDYFRSLVIGSPDSLDAYWQEVSYGAVDLQGSEAFGWFTLNQPRSRYISPRMELPRLNRLAQDCASAADPVVDFSSFTGLNLVFNDCIERPRGGVVTLRLEDVRRRISTTWLCTGWGSSHRILAHEIAHSFGVPHSQSPSGDEYGNPWDALSSGACCGEHSRFGRLAQQPIAYGKDLLGWIPEQHKLVMPYGTRLEAELQALSETRLVSGAYLMVQIPLPGNDERFYTVEARRRTGFDRALAGDAVVIHLVDPNHSSAPARLILPPGDWESSPMAGAWTVGMQFLDEAVGIEVSVLSATEHGYRVGISIGT